MPFDLNFLGTFDTGGGDTGGGDTGGGGGGGGNTGGGSFDQMVFSDPPTLAELERLYRERWHTRPDWMTTGATPKIVGTDTLPTGASYNAGDNRITIPNGVTIPDFSGWDFLETQTTVLLEGSARILNFENNRMAPRYTVKADRITHEDGAGTPVCLQFAANSTAQIDRIARCMFTQHPLHEGVGGPGSFLRAQTTSGSTTFASVPLMEFCSFEGYDADAIKGSWGGMRRYCFIDPARNMPNDATEWDPNATYNRNDVVWDPGANKRIRLCLNNGVTSAPNFSGTLTSTSDWRALDPHSDGDQPTSTPETVDSNWLGSVFIRDYRNRRFASRQYNRGVVNALRYIANSGSQDIGPTYVRCCLFTDEVEIANSNSPAISFADASRSYSPTTPKVAEHNWYQTRLTSSSGTHITVSANIPDWTFPAAASVTGVAASYGTVSQTVSLGFTPSLGGWMRVVVSSSSTPMTAEDILHARNGDAGLLALFEIDAETNTAASGAAPLVLSNGQTVYVHALYQAGGGVDTLIPVQTVTEGTGTQNSLMLDELDFDGYVFDGTGKTMVPVILSGDGPAGEQLHCRGESAGGNTAWYPTTVAQDGTWTIAMEIPVADWGNWYTPAVRVGTDDGTKVTGTNTFGCGHVIVFIGQSELYYFLSERTNYAQLTKEIDAENLTYIAAEDSAGTTELLAPRTARMTSSNLARANVGTLAMANAFRHIIGDDRKLCIINGCRSGTSPFDLWDDTNNDRDADFLKAAINKARASGSEIGAVIINWYNAPASTIANMLFNWAPGMHGQLAGGSTFTLGTTHSTAPSSNARSRVDLCFWDADAAAGDLGRGLFSRDRTKLYLMLPMPFHNVSGDNDSFLESPRMTNDERAGVLAFANDPTVQTYLGSIGPTTSLADYDQEDTGTTQGIHPNRLDGLGIPWFANQHLPALLRAAGQTVGEPQITGVSQVNSTTIDVTIDLPNGGNLTTLAALGVGNHPGTTTQANIPHLHDCVGFQIDRSAGTKRPVYNTSGGSSEPALYKGTITIHDSGTGTAPNRTGTVRIVLDQAIASGDQLTYLDGQANAVLNETRDEAARLFNFMLLEHVSGWSDGGSLYPYHGVPVRPQTPMATL